ncbi:hypothetical protein TELCIR_00864 [Teladorsagia circumcincta]|uniref:Uncharacterized protein n=1 Tax=Teladorsagia circumcincta TaxID=45464 RepID=A0A2G9V4Y6_TELCI|nr:hypothetical protein TELCIR_00864 [Teladorsagia circumcincta]
MGTGNSSAESFKPSPFGANLSGEAQKPPLFGASATSSVNKPLFGPSSSVPLYLNQHFNSGNQLLSVARLHFSSAPLNQLLRQPQLSNSRVLPLQLRQAPTFPLHQVALAKWWLLGADCLSGNDAIRILVSC